MTSTEVPRAATLADMITPHLPFLRRHARALTGSQAVGDAHVAALLEAVVLDRSVIDTALGPRIGLYAAFHRLWSSARVDTLQDPATGPEAVALARLGRLTPRSKQALLLTAVEGFSAGEAGVILAVDAAEVAMLVDDAINDLRSQTRARVLVIEDEPIIAMDIETIVADLGHDVVATADTHDSAVTAALQHQPDLVLADIQLADGSSGIDAVKEILSAFEVPVIFITAYPDRLLTGARPEPAFLVSKPFRAETLQAAVGQAMFFRSPTGST